MVLYVWFGIFCTCVATGNNQTGVFIKYFRHDSGLDSGINLHIADHESKMVIKLYIRKMTKQVWRLYVQLYSVHYTKNLNMPEN